MAQCIECVKYVLFVFNFCLWLLGCALLSVGVWMMMDDSASHVVQRMTVMERNDEYQISYSAAGEGDMTKSLSIVFVVFGILIIFVTSIGCCGAVRGSTCLLGTFAVCLFVLVIALLSVGAWAFVKKDNLNTFSTELRNITDANLDRGVKMYDKDELSKQFMDNVQKKLLCCGSQNGFDDYKPVNPDRCEKQTYKQPCSDPYFMFVGNEIREFLLKRYTIIVGVAIGVALCVAFGFVFTLILYCLTRRTTRLLIA